MFWIFTFGLLTGLALDLSKAQQAKFSCDGRITGYYADIASGCQVYHMCDGIGRQFSYTCPNATLFQQRMLICDHWYMVNCSRSEDDYSANLLIGQKKPFVEDSEINPYHRTPRPDLLSHPSSAAEYNIIYRTGGGDHDKISKNIVGAEDEPSSSTDESNYYPPSHWSTAYRAQTTSRPNRANFDNRRNSNQNNVYKTNYSTVKKGARSKAINFDSPNRNGNNFSDAPRQKVAEFKYNTAPTAIPINYKSNFKATTPVFPLTVEDSSEAPSNIGILPPDTYKKSETANLDSAGAGNNFPDPTASNIDSVKYEPAPTVVPVNYKSNFPATTPVFPLTVEDSSEAPNDIGILPPIPYKNLQTEIDTAPIIDNQVNFKSNFKATTPVYPTVLDQKYRDKEIDTEILSPPSRNSNVNLQGDIETAPIGDQPQVIFKSNFKATTPVYPTVVDQKYRDKESDTELLSPPSGNFNDEQTETDAEPLGEQPQVNFKSNFKATTPVYPTVLDQKYRDKEIDTEILSPPSRNSIVNFQSNFKATTPVYPTSVEPTSPNPGEVGLLPPNNSITEDHGALPKSDVRALSLSIEPPQFDKSYRENREHVETTAASPSMFYQPPKLDPDFTSPDSEVEVKPGIEIENMMKSLSKQQWQNIRQRFHIPEYDFPLDDATRPSYDSLLNSFSAKPVLKK